MKTNTKSIKTKVTIIIVALLFPIFVCAQSKPEVNHSKEIIPHVRDQIVPSKVMGNQRVEDGTGIVRAVYSPNYAVNEDEPEEMAKQYLNAFALPLLLKSNINDLEHERTIETPGGFKVQFKQKAAGYPVYGAEIKVSINRNNKVVFVTNSYKPVGNLQTEINTSPEAAILTSKNHIGISGRLNFEKVETVVYNINRLKSVVVYKVNLIPAEDHFGDWELLVDAGTGTILRAEDKACYHHPDGVKDNGSGWVFDPDPVTNAKTLYGATQFVDNNDADSDSLTAQLKTVVLQDITYDGNMYRLEGPYAAIADFEAPFTGLYEQESSDFYYTRSNEAFEAVNAYFHLDKSMRYINDTLGFDVMPFQYEGGVQYDPHGVAGENNAYYLSTGQIVFGTPPNSVDMGEDHAIIIHELGHGLHDWITNDGLSQVDGLSEGLADFWAQSYTRSLGIFEPGDEAYDYFGIWGGMPGWGPPYLRVTNFEGHYPEAMNGETHHDGQLWSSSLMSIYDLIGKEATDMNCWEGISMLNLVSNQIDAAFAFSQADNDLYDGEHLEDIYNVFYERGYFLGPVAPFFTANETNGEGPRDVVFTDQSISFLNEIVSWEWDFNNDGEIDSYDQNPTYTFTDVGGYTISLIVSDGEYTDTLVKKNYITVNGGIFVFETSENERNHSGSFIRDYLETLGYDVIYSTYYPSSLLGFDAVFLSLGNIDEYQDKGTFLEYARTVPIQEYLEEGGTLYTEGSPFLPVPEYFGYPNANEFAGLFGVASLIPTFSENPISKLIGLDGSLCEGMIFNASNQLINWYIDKLVPDEEAVVPFEEEGYGNVSIYNEGDYGQKTFHFAYALAELVDEDPINSKNNVLLKVLDFFEMLPAGYLVSGFTSDKQVGGVSLEVQFIDLTLSDPDYPILSREWDFDNDGVIDSQEQNPSWIFNDPGEHNITLITTNDLNSDTLTKHGFITINHGHFVYEGKPDGEGYSGSFIRDYMMENSFYGVTYSNKIPNGLDGYYAVFLSFGNFDLGNTVLEDDIADIIVHYLEEGGNVYLEGGDSFGWDQPDNSELLGLFGLQQAEDGTTNPINLLAGQPDALTTDQVFTSSSQLSFSYIDKYGPKQDAIIAFTESGYGTVAVQNTGEFSQRTFCFSYTLADLDDGETPNTRDELLERICNFFDIYTTVYSPVEEKIALEIYPNPTKSESTIKYFLTEESDVSIDIFDITGNLMTSLVNKFQTAGAHQLIWNTSVLPEGLYFCRMRNGTTMTSKKIVKTD